MRHSVPLALLLLALGVGRADAIVGPSTDAPEAARHVVMVLNRQGGTAGFCTGVVLAPDVVMTAAHCVPVGADLRIHLPGPASAPILLPVEEVARHPGYRPDAIAARQRSIDLALIHLPQALPGDHSPVRLGTSAATSVGASFTIIGYGVAQEGVGASSGRLRAATLVADAPLSDVLLWAKDPARRGAGACTGDSGGWVRGGDADEVRAIVVWSSGAGKARCGERTQALWLAPLKPWIVRTLEGWGAPTR